MSEKTISDLKHAAHEWAGASALAAAARARGVGWREQKRKQTSRESFKNVFLGMLTALEDRITALEAENARLREELRQADEANQRALEAATHKDCQIAKDAGTVYAAIPPLPVTAETAEAATSALVEFCNLFSVFIEFDAAMRGDGGEG